MGVSATKAYIATNQTPIEVFDLGSNAITGTIETDGLISDIVIDGTTAYVSSSNPTNRISVVDTESDQITRTIEPDSTACVRPAHMFVDSQGELNIICRGRARTNSNGAIHVVDLLTGNVVANIPVAGQLGGELGFETGIEQGAYYSEAMQEIFVVQGRTLLRFDTETNSVTSTIPILGDREIGAVAFDAVRQRFYLGRLLKDQWSTVRGSVTIHDLSGQEIGGFAVGFGPFSIALSDAQP